MEFAPIVFAVLHLTAFEGCVPQYWQVSDIAAERYFYCEDADTTFTLATQRKYQAEAMLRRYRDLAVDSQSGTARHRNEMVEIRDAQVGDVPAIQVISTKGAPGFLSTEGTEIGSQSGVDVTWAFYLKPKFADDYLVFTIWRRGDDASVTRPIQDVFNRFWARTYDSLPRSHLALQVAKDRQSIEVTLEPLLDVEIGGGRVISDGQGDLIFRQKDGEDVDLLLDQALIGGISDVSAYFFANRKTFLYILEDLEAYGNRARNEFASRFLDIYNAGWRFPDEPPGDADDITADVFRSRLALTSIFIDLAYGDMTLTFDDANMFGGQDVECSFTLNGEFRQCGLVPN